MIGRPNHHDRQTDHPDRPADREQPGVQKRCNFWCSFNFIFGTILRNIKFGYDRKYEVFDSYGIEDLKMDIT